MVDWSRLDPDAATRLRVLTPEEQTKAARTLTSVSAQANSKRFDFLDRALDELHGFDRKSLSHSQRVSYDILDWNLSEIKASREVLFVRYPMNQMMGDQIGLIGALTEGVTIASKADAENHLARLAAVGKRADEWIAGIRAAQAKGVVPPSFILERTVNQLQSFADPAPASNLFVTSFTERLAQLMTLPAEDRSRLEAEAARIVGEVVYPAWKRIVDTLQAQRAKATVDAGYWKQPQGAKAYAAALRWYTTTDMTPDQIHDLGLKQVERFEKELDVVLERQGLTKGSVAERYRQLETKPGVAYEDSPKVREAVLADATSYIAQSEARMEEAFRLPARYPVVVRRTPLFREASSAAQYVAPPVGSTQSGIFYMPMTGPTFSRLGMRTLAIMRPCRGITFRVCIDRNRRTCRDSGPWPGATSRGAGLVSSLPMARAGASMPRPWPRSWVCLRGTMWA